MKQCEYLIDIPLGYCCDIANEECNVQKCIKEQEEAKWKYLMRIAEDYSEEEE